MENLNNLITNILRMFLKLESYISGALSEEKEIRKNGKNKSNQDNEIHILIIYVTQKLLEIVMYEGKKPEQIIEEIKKDLKYVYQDSETKRVALNILAVAKRNIDSLFSPEYVITEKMFRIICWYVFKQRIETGDSFEEILEKAKVNITKARISEEEQEIVIKYIGLACGKVERILDAKTENERELLRKEMNFLVKFIAIQKDQSLMKTKDELVNKIVESNLEIRKISILREALS